jgi:predicted dinucleotide-binding enzyme
MDKPKIGILGSGSVAQALGAGFIKHGYNVMLGTRDKLKLEKWKNAYGDKEKVGSFEEAAKFGTILVLAVKGSAAKDVLKLAGESSISGKTIIDTTNPIAESAPENGVLKFFTNLDKSLMEQLQGEHSKSNFVKAFNMIGAGLMVNPDFGAIKPTMFICGNNDMAKKETTEILELFGYEVSDMGKAEAARAIEPLCILWCIPGFLKNEWTHAFKLLKSESANPV